MAHALENFGSGGGAADIPVFVRWVSADDEEVCGGLDAAVASPGGKYEDVACVHGDRLAAISAEDEVGVAGREPQNFVRSGVIVMKVVYAVAPLRRPAVGGEESFHCFGEIVASWKGVAVEKDGERAVRHPAVGLQVKLQRRNCRR